MANNKVQLSDGTVLLDLTGDTVTPETLLSGVTAHDAAGEQISGAVVIGGGNSPDAAEIRGSWLSFALDTDRAIGETWQADMGGQVIRMSTFMGAMISPNDDYVLPITLTYHSQEDTFYGYFVVPLLNSSGRCALTEMEIAGDTFVVNANGTVIDVFDFSSSTADSAYEAFLYVRPNPT